MKKLVQSILILLIVQPMVFSAGPSDDSSLVLWYKTAADNFTESLVLGNGWLGMMVFGGVEKDRIVLNEESVWSGSPGDDNRNDAYKQLPEIRRLLLEGKNDEACAHHVRFSFSRQAWMRLSSHAFPGNEPQRARFRSASVLPRSLRSLRRRRENHR